MQRLVAKNGLHQTNICYDDIGIYAQYVYTILGSILNTFGRVYAWWERESSLWPIIIFEWISTTILKFKLSIFVICNCCLNETVPKLTQQLDLSMVLEVSIIGPNTLKAMGLREVLNFDYVICLSRWFAIASSRWEMPTIGTHNLEGMGLK
jgi:hypothetical protein